ncbi:type II toxin-antitoxin system Phd/YefM family antitoxin [Niveispirillum sp. KHB5.9]|uniref:type II toxin-antitoxin system Phd/YefM family antitoxin n=1 Tax=Niveispirillum sp. KHB5.9 TaxID=3400269 RepID=UPI003A8C3EE6
MPQVTIHSAEANLPKLIEQAMNREDVIITKEAKAMVRLVPVTQGSFKVGILKDTLGQAPDFLEPMGQQELGSWEDGN